MNNLKEDSKYKTIGEVAKILNLVDKQRGTLSTHFTTYERLSQTRQPMGHRQLLKYQRHL